MVKIDFTKFKLFTSISHETLIEVNVSREFADAMYNNSNGVAAHSLALRIYNAKGEIELNEEEVRMCKELALRGCTPAFVDSLDANFTEVSNN